MSQKDSTENIETQMEKEILRKIAEILLKEHLLTVEEQIAFTQLLQEA